MFKRERERIYWTRHSLEKMKYYRISPSRVKRIIKSPQRVEEGVAKETIAVMQRNDRRKKKEELWVMYQLNKKLKIISTWRYPGQSPERKPPPIPKDILEELKKTKIL